MHMELKLFDSERKIMEVLWKEGDRTAKELALILEEQIGWNKNTTYTVIKKCIEKGAVERLEPHYLCRAVITKQQALEAETEDFVNKAFDGSAALLFFSLLSQKKLPKEELQKLKKMINDME